MQFPTPYTVQSQASHDYVVFDNQYVFSTNPYVIYIPCSLNDPLCSLNDYVVCNTLSYSLQQPSEPLWLWSPTSHVVLTAQYPICSLQHPICSLQHPSMLSPKSQWTNMCSSMTHVSSLTFHVVLTNHMQSPIPHYRYVIFNNLTNRQLFFFSFVVPYCLNLVTLSSHEDFVVNNFK